ncbi:MAG: hypothetical protein HYR76_12730 [Ignavibacteria bacterium]|nr:hypothetical protein [Ignavibacteria bacterium]
MIQSKDDYQFGNAFHAHLGTSYQLADHANVLLQVNGRFQNFADVGSTDEPGDNTGGTWIYFSPGIGLQLNDALSSVVYVQVPIYQNVHGIQQTAKFNLSFGLTYNFDLFAGQ